MFTYDCRTRASAPLNRSRTIATTITKPVPAPAPIITRQKSRAVSDPEYAASTPHTAKSAVPTSSTGRRPTWSDNGPETNGATAKPAMNTLNESAAPSAVTPKDSAVSASRGKLMSVANADNVASAASKSVKTGERAERRR